MAHAIFCTVKSSAEASSIVDHLKEAGFTSSDISVLMPDTQGSKNFAVDNETKSPEGATIGAGTGAVLGGGLGWLAGIGALAIPGVGPLIAAGPIVAALTGVALGGTVERVASSFEETGNAAKATKCEAMAGLIKEAEETMAEDVDADVSDAILIGLAQKVEHYEIATYGTLCTWADQLGYTAAKKLLGQNMDDEFEDDNNERERKAFFIPTPEEIQEACAEIQNSWTDDVRDSRRVLSMRWLSNTSEMECIREDCARVNGGDLKPDHASPLRLHRRYLAMNR